MLKKLEIGYALVLDAWDQFMSDNNTVYKTDNWTVEVRSNGECLVLTGYEMLFIFPVKNLADRLLPESNRSDDLYNIEFMVQKGCFGELTLKEVLDGFEVVDLAIKNFYKESQSEYSNAHWRASIHIFNKDEKSMPFVLLAGYGHIFVYSISNYINWVLPRRPDGSEYSGLMTLLNRELDKSNSAVVGIKYSDTLWPSLLPHRFILYNTARCIDILMNKELNSNDKEILMHGYLDFSNKAAQRILNKSSDIRFFQSYIQRQIIDKYIPGLGKELLIKSHANGKQLKIHLQRIPTIYFLDEPKNRVIAQMCLWAYRQSLSGQDSVSMYKYKEMQKIAPFIKMNILDQFQREELLFFILGYIKQIGVKEVPEEYREDCANICLFNLINKWIGPISVSSFDSYIAKTLKGSYIDSLKIDKSEGLSTDFDKEKDIIGYNLELNKSYSPVSKKKKDSQIMIKPQYDSIVTVHEAVEILLKDASFKRYYQKEAESLSRWIYLQIDKGAIVNEGKSMVKIMRDGIIKQTRECLVSKESIELIKKRFRERGIKRDLVKYQVDKKGISERGARKRIKDNLNKGMTIEEVAKKIMQRCIE